VIGARRNRDHVAVVHFSGDEQEVRDATTELVAAWASFEAAPYYRRPPTSVAADLAALRRAVGNTDAPGVGGTRALAEAVSDYLSGVTFWCDEQLKLAELRLRRAAYPLPDRAGLRGCHPLRMAPLRTPRRPVVPSLSTMPFRPGPVPIDEPPPP
jgi:hypothetical protein